MAHIIVNYIAPVFLLGISVLMFMSDTSFFKAKNFEDSPNKSIGWQIVRLCKYIALLSAAYMIFKLDPQFFQDRETLQALINDPAQRQAVASYSGQWCMILILSLIFACLFLADVWCRIKTIQQYHNYKLSLFIQEEVKNAASRAASSALTTANMANEAASMAEAADNSAADKTETEDAAVQDKE
ncbi:hypothetical protein IJT93_02320 [bacterium]|nr:hypothetical protein [bacterium]